MKIKYLLFILLLNSCGTTQPSGGYVITTYAESGEIQKVYEANSINKKDKIVKFVSDGVETTVSGSYKIEIRN